MQEEKLIIKGTVLDSSRGVFQVQLENQHIIKSYLSGKMKKYKIRVLKGDKVSIECSPYDLERGRIVEREKVKRRSA